VLDLFRPFVRRLADDGLLLKAPKFPAIQVPEVEVQVIDPETQDRVLQAIAWERRGAFLACAREALRPSEVRAADLVDFDPAKGTLRVDKTMQGARLDARVAHTKNRTARVKEVWDQQLREWLEWRLAQATPKRRLRGETALFPNPTARNTQKRWTVSGLEREWRRACARAGVDYIPLQQGTRHSILTMLGQTLPERVLRDFSRHRDARSLDRYSKPRATRGAIVRAFPGPSVAPSQSKGTEPRSTDVPLE
jgi:integrase